MKKSDASTMELGNLMYGHSRGVYHIEPRMEYQTVFYDFLEANGFDGYGRPADKADLYENDMFAIRPYYWGDDDEIAKLPNFLYKPTGLEIRWYKYPMRDAYASSDISVEEFKTILDECSKSMNK